MDKGTYAGQYASRKKLVKKMDSSNKQRLRTLHVQLGTLLNQRKALNSKVTTRHFDQFREAVDAEADPHEIKQRLSRLEQSLKHEGLYKNVKSDFVMIRKDILGLLHGTDNHQSRHILPGISHMAKDRTFYIASKSHNDNSDQASATGTATSYTPKQANGLSSDDMRMLNTAIGRLYRHLQLNAKEQQENTMVTENTHKEATIQKENVNILTLTQFTPDETFHDIVLKLKNFEREFQRQKVQQQREQMRLLEEIKRLNKNSSELRRENERIKGVQPILTKAKGKQVERIEERHRTEKKDMEEKIIELESGMKKSLALLLQDKEEVRTHIRSDVDSLTSSLNNLHYMVVGHYHDTPSQKNTDETEILPTKDLLNIITSVAGGVQILKTKSQEYSRQADEVSSWRKSFKELEREISKFCRGYSDEDDDQEFTALTRETDAQMLVHVCKTKLQKTKDNLNVRLKGYTDTTSLMKRKERDMIKYRRSIEVLQGQIAKLHDQVLSVQIQDISISMPEFDRRHDLGDRSDGSADELPEADREEQQDFLDKLKQTGVMVSHFQKLITERTAILNKMENDMLPLKIRVNRLHEEIVKAMNSGGSPDQELADEPFKSHRSFSPDGPSNMFSRDVANMLKKLSKMELAIRHLLETYATSHGRASI